MLFLVTALGGAVRKWLISSGAVSNAILGIQMVLPFLMFYFRPYYSVSPFRKFTILYLYFFYLLVHIIHPLQLTFFHGLFGMLVHGGFWLGVFYYFANRSLFHPSMLMKWFLAIALVEMILAFTQYALPASHFLNKYARDIGEIAVVGDKVRITGTFSYLSGFTAYTIFYGLLVWAIIRLKYPDWLVGLSITMGLAASFMTGSRSGLVIYLLFVLTAVLREYPIKRLFSVLGRLIFPVLIFTAAVLLYKKIPLAKEVGKAYDNFMQRVESNRRSGEETSRLYTDLYYLQNARYQHPVFGVGLGSTYQGANILFGISRYVQEFGYVESEFSRVLLEGGWIIVILKIIMGFLMAFQLSFKGGMRWAIWFVAAIGQPIVFNPHNATFLMLGIMLVDNIYWRQQMMEQARQKALAKEREERWKQKEQQAALAAS